MLYAVQSYAGSNPASIAAVADGSRTAGAVFAYDSWRLSPVTTVSYGARYARYGYVTDGLLSPRAQLQVGPLSGWTLTVAASHRAEAPGADEFDPGTAWMTWLPPERTFSTLADARVHADERPARTRWASNASCQRERGGDGADLPPAHQDQVTTLFGVDGGTARPSATTGITTWPRPATSPRAAGASASTRWSAAGSAAASTTASPIGRVAGVGRERGHRGVRALGRAHGRGAPARPDGVARRAGAADGHPHLRDVPREHRLRQHARRRRCRRCSPPASTSTSRSRSRS
jgi:hypothetical protein